MYEQILYEVDDPIATITMNRPDTLNAHTPRMGDEIRHAFAQAEKDERVVAIILTGSGRGFCAGADMKELDKISRGGARWETPNELEADPGDPEVDADFRGTYTYPMAIPKPVIAAINGPAAGMGVPIALACDIRFMSDRAILTTSFSRRGLIAEWGISWMLAQAVGPAQALDLLFSARRVGAEECASMGLVNRVVPHDELMATARDYAMELATYCSPASMRVMKRQVYKDLTERLGPAEKEAIARMIDTFGSDDFREGVVSFMEKRPPKFKRVQR